MFFARCTLAIIGLLPERWMLSRYLRLMFNYDDCKKKVIEWHKVQLEELDPTFRLQQASFKLAIARERAHAKGIGPLDPGYPDILDFHPFPRLRKLR